MNLNIETVQKLTKDKLLLKLCAEYKQIEQKLNFIGPLVDAIYNNVLSEYDFRDREGKPIKSYEHIYTISCGLDAVEYRQYSIECQKRLKSAGLMRYIKPGHCPKLVLQTKLTKIQWEIVQIVRDYFKMPEIYRLEHIKNLTNLTVKLMKG